MDMTIKEILLYLQTKIYESRNKKGMIDSQHILGLIDDLLFGINNKSLSPKKLLFIEDGSIDVDDLQNDITDPNVKVVIYRQGSRIPELMSVSSKEE